MGKLDLTKYINKTQESTISADEWNSVFSNIQEAVNDNNTPGILDVLVDGKSVVANNIASITLKTEEEPETETPQFFVNDVLTEPTDGVIKLAAESTYKLQGTLKGSIVIGDSVEATNDTTILLDGVDIVSDSSENYGIMYAPTAKTLQITLVANSVNTISCTNEASITEEQKAAVYSEKNMVIKGDGALYVSNKGGHGVKASELRIMGNPVIYASATHDAIHGNSALDIYGGDFSIDGANDAFGTGDTGVINVFGGSFRAKNVLENVFDSKIAGYFFTRVPILSDFATTTNVINNMTNCDPATYFGTGTVTCYSDKDFTADATEITAVEGVYALTTAYAKVKGYVKGTINAPIKSTDISLEGAYVDGNITYTYQELDATTNTYVGKKKLQITSEKETINFVVASTTDAINSVKNVSIEIKSKSYLGIYSKEGSGINGFDVTLNDSSGVLSVQNCGQYGIYGRMIYIGTDADASGKLFEGALIATGNKVCDIYAALRAEGTEGIISLLNSGMLGSLTTGSIEAEGYADLNSSPRVNYKSINGIVIGDPKIKYTIV